MTKLIEVGYWGGDSSSDGRPPPQELVDPEWRENHKDVYDKVVRYVRLSFIESYEMGYSHCRFGCDLEREMGACSLTDGMYVWPEGYWHYLTVHSVRPPKPFIEHVLRQYEEQAAVTKVDRLLMWNAETSTAEVLPTELEAWIVKNTTLVDSLKELFAEESI